MALHKEEKAKRITEFGASAQDSGSTAVQVALLTKRLNELTAHCKINSKEFSSRRGLLKLVCKIKIVLCYLIKKDEKKYKGVKSK